MASPGDRIRVKTLTDEIEGILMPSYDQKSILIKLPNGYNVGYEEKEILSVTLLEPKKPASEKPIKEVVFKSGLKTITLLHCGGTIASKVDYETGAVKAKFSPEELVEMFPELGAIANIKSRLVANMLSENMRFAHYNQIAKEIEAVIKDGTDGIIVTHGTDTLHYTGAALTFVLENLNVPILLVGAQRSSDRGSSDAFFNLKCAAQFIARSDFAGVALCMHASPDDEKCAILPGVKSRKMHSSRRDAFKAVNAEPYALVDGDGMIEWIIKEHPKKVLEKKPLNLKLFKEELKVGILKAHPNMFAEEFKPYNKFHGLILEGTGLGHFPIEKYDESTAEHELIFAAMERLAKKIPVVMTVQTIFGVVNMDIYSPGRKQIEAGVLGTQLDMPPETAFIKLAWLLSNYPKKRVRELFSHDFRGEIGERSELGK
jgi:glutamyl-tRNA(Gln) amidotransferase subunit D